MSAIPIGRSSSRGHDLKTADLKLSNAQVGNFVNTCTLPGEVVGPVPVTRGWVAVDAEIRGKTFRFLSTHLEGDCLGVPFLQESPGGRAACRSLGDVPARPARGRPSILRPIGAPRTTT